ncbi:MAG TPA: arsenic resistance N-acetyltransferase ArsN2 [Mucilaginibacter sp.]
MTIKEAYGYTKQIIALLESANLPVADLPENPDNFFVAIKNDEVIGVIGMEIHGGYGLLRSLAVSAAYRGLGIAGELITRIEALGRLKGLTGLYLLTETAPDYFSKKGFVQTDRALVPPEVQQSSEFSHVCPVSAIVMNKSLL